MAEKLMTFRNAAAELEEEVTQQPPLHYPASCAGMLHVTRHTSHVTRHPDHPGLFDYMKGNIECLRCSLQHFASDFSPFMSFYELIASQENNIRKSLQKLPCPPFISSRRVSHKTAPPAATLHQAPSAVKRSAVEADEHQSKEDAAAPSAPIEALLLAQHFQSQGHQLQQAAATMNQISSVFSILASLVEQQQRAQENVEANLEVANDELGAGTQILHRCRKIMQSGVLNVFLIYVMFSFCLLLMHMIYE
jgi:hypothetical protein